MLIKLIESLLEDESVYALVKNRFSEDELKAKLLELAERLDIDLTDESSPVHDGEVIETAYGAARAVVLTPEEQLALVKAREIYARMGL
jgi:hypothetical protein